MKKKNSLYDFSTEQNSIKEDKHRYCKVCGKKTIFKHFCMKCKSMIPSGFNRHQEPEILTEEIKRNLRMKEMFNSSKRVGRLYLDTEKNMFHIDNAYYNVNELEGYSFYSGEPRLKTSNIYVADVYFTYTPMGQSRRVRMIMSAARCKYECTGNKVYIEPPACMIMAREQFQDMIVRERDYLLTQLAIAQMQGKQQ